MSKHAAEFAKRRETHGPGSCSPVKSLVELADVPGLRLLKNWQFDILLLLGVLEFPSKTRCMIDLSQSLNRARMSTTGDIIGCVTPKMHQWLTDRARFLHGSEALALQGIHYGPRQEHLTNEYSSEFLQDLAGNAFHSGCMAATVIATIVAVGVALLRQRGLRLNSYEPVSLHVPLEVPDEGDLDDMWGLN